MTIEEREEMMTGCRKKNLHKMQESVSEGLLRSTEGRDGERMTDKTQKTNKEETRERITGFLKRKSFLNTREYDLDVTRESIAGETLENVVETAQKIITGRIQGTMEEKTQEITIEESREVITGETLETMKEALEMMTEETLETMKGER